MTATSQLWKIVQEKHPRAEERNRPTLPKSLIDAIRVALEAGLSCEQIASAIHLFVGMDDMEKGMPAEELVSRCQEIGRIMSGWNDIKKTRRCMLQSLQHDE